MNGVPQTRCFLSDQENRGAGLCFTFRASYESALRCIFSTLFPTRQRLCVAGVGPPLEEGNLDGVGEGQPGAAGGEAAFRWRIWLLGPPAPSPPGMRRGSRKGLLGAKAWIFADVSGRLPSPGLQRAAVGHLKAETWMGASVKAVV